MVSIAVVLFLALTTAVILFQLASALGAPWGEFTMGGRFPGALPPVMRIVALAQIVVLFLFAVIVLVRAGMAFGGYYAIGRVGIWFVVGFFVLGSLLNLATPSKKERLLWAPVNVLMLIAAILIAVGR